MTLFAWQIEEVDFGKGGGAKNVTLKRAMQKIGSATASIDCAPTRSGITVNHRRAIPPGAGQALEKLGHAIEYLADEIVNDGGSLSGAEPRVKAVEILMALNREIYHDCPPRPMFRQRIQSILRTCLGRSVSGGLNENREKSA